MHLFKYNYIYIFKDMFTLHHKHQILHSRLQVAIINKLKSLEGNFFLQNVAVKF